MNNQNPEEPLTQKSLADVINLPNHERKLVNWIIDQKKVTLAEVSVQINQSEEVAKNLLQTLINQGFIQELKAGDSVEYQPCFISQKKSQISANIWDKL
jgi:predicted transcriptional regulator